MNLKINNCNCDQNQDKPGGNVIAPNTGYIYVDDDRTQGFMTGGRSMIVDYRGQVLHVNYQTGDAFVGAPINIDGLRQHRMQATHMNWMPHLKAEVLQLIYRKAIWPKNMAENAAPGRREAMREVFYQVVKDLEADGVFTASGSPEIP